MKSINRAPLPLYIYNSQDNKQPPGKYNVQLLTTSFIQITYNLTKLKETHKNRIKH